MSCKNPSHIFSGGWYNGAALPSESIWFIMSETLYIYDERRYSARDGNWKKTAFNQWFHQIMVYFAGNYVCSLCTHSILFKSRELLQLHTEAYHPGEGWLLDINAGVNWLCPFLFKFTLKKLQEKNTFCASVTGLLPGWLGATAGSSLIMIIKYRPLYN